MYSVKKFSKGEVMAEARISIGLVQSIAPSDRTWAVVDESGKVATYTNAVTGKVGLVTYPQKKTAQMEADFFNRTAATK